MDRVADTLDEDHDGGDDEEIDERANGVSDAESTYTDNDLFLDFIDEYDGDDLNSREISQQNNLEGNLTQRLEAVQEPASAGESSASSLGKRYYNSSAKDAPRKRMRGDPPQALDNPSADTAANPLDDPIIVAHNPRYHICFQARNLQYGIQYEIARLVSAGAIEYSDILIDVLDQLKGKSNHDGVPLVAQALMQVTSTVIGTVSSKEKEAKNPGKELDLEEEILKKDANGCLGFNKADDHWYGGKVNFRGKLKKASAKASSPSFKIVLEKAELGPSNRFARKFGSKSFLRVKVTKECLSYEKELVSFFKHPFILNGFVFRAFYEKDKSVFLFMTNEVVEGFQISPQRLRPDRISLVDFLDWHNPIIENTSQTMTKWSARFALGLSNSAPGILLEAKQIMQIKDVVSSKESDMTDGAGLINKAALLRLKKKFDWDDWPTAIQCRINGNKGLLYHDPSDDCHEPCVWIRPSQTKIRYPALSDPALRVIDVLRSSHARVSCQLSTEVIINLWHNGVPASAFEILLQRGLEDNVVTPLMTWDGQDAMFELWYALCKRGGVMTARAARRETSMSRVKGYGDRQTEEFDDEDEDGIRQLSSERSTAWWNDEVSGCPSVLEETVMYLLDAGFTPKNCSVLKDKLHKIIKSAIDNYVRSYRIDVPMSVTAFIVPDEDGELQEGEVFFKSSRRNLIGPDGLETDMVLGDVLLTRHPCKLPTDVVKWRCVDKPRLRNRTDVIILSVKGLHRAAEILSGGDYDGDKGVLIFQPELVKPFVNPPFTLSLPPDDLEKDFETTTNETVGAFLVRVPRVSDSMAAYIHEVQEFLLRGLTDRSVVGAYSNMHDVSAYMKGYAHPETLRLAHMFNLVLDGAKTGLKVSPHVLSKDRKEYAQKVLQWKEFSKNLKEVTTDETNAARARPLVGTKFVMDIIQDYAKKQGEIQLSKVEQKMNACSVFIADKELTAPWDAAWSIANRSQNEDRLKDLNAIKTHVQGVYQKHRSQVTSVHGRKKGAAFTDLPIEIRQDELRALSKEFAAKPSPLAAVTEAEAAMIKASYAYLYDVEQRARAGTKWTRFPWDMAIRELCAIKARAGGSWKALNGEFYERMMIKVRR